MQGPMSLTQSPSVFLRYKTINFEVNRYNRYDTYNMVSAVSLPKLGMNCFTLADTVQPFLLSKAVFRAYLFSRHFSFWNSVLRLSFFLFLFLSVIMICCSFSSSPHYSPPTPPPTPPPSPSIQHCVRVHWSARVRVYVKVFWMRYRHTYSV